MRVRTTRVARKCGGAGSSIDGCDGLSYIDCDRVREGAATPHALSFLILHLRFVRYSVCDQRSVDWPAVVVTCQPRPSRSLGNGAPPSSRPLHNPIIISDSSLCSLITQLPLSPASRSSAASSVRLVPAGRVPRRSLPPPPRAQTACLSPISGFSRRRSYPSLIGGLAIGSLFAVSALRIREGLDYGYEAAGPFLFPLLCVRTAVRTARSAVHGLGRCRADADASRAFRFVQRPRRRS